MKAREIGSSSVEADCEAPEVFELLNSVRFDCGLCRSWRQQLAVRTSGHLMSVDDLRSTMASSAAMIFDGDNENDNVLNTNSTYWRVDALAWGGAILDKLFAGTAGQDNDPQGHVQHTFVQNDDGSTWFV
jgi:hypothetical protein